MSPRPLLRYLRFRRSERRSANDDRTDATLCSVTYELLITRAATWADVASEPLDRQAWLNLAIATPALRLTHRFPEASSEGDVEYLPELRTIARRLHARLLHADGTEAS